MKRKREGQAADGVGADTRHVLKCKGDSTARLQMESPLKSINETDLNFSLA
jgi:hypothetical protein